MVATEDFDFDAEYEKSLNENGIATSGSNNPSVSNYGGTRYTWGIDYKIVPLSFNLQQKGNEQRPWSAEIEDIFDQIYVGDAVSGVGLDDGVIYKGKVVNFEFKENSSRELSAVVVLDMKNMKTVRLDPESVTDIPSCNKSDKRFGGNHVLRNYYARVFESFWNDINFDF